MEARLHKALALVVYGDDRSTLDPEGALTVLPVFRIGDEQANRLKTLVKDKGINLELSAHTEYPKSRSQDWFAVKKGSREIRLALTATKTNCKSLTLPLTHP